MRRWSRVRRTAIWIGVLAGVTGALLPFARGAIAAGAALLLVTLVATQVSVWLGSLRVTSPSAYELARTHIQEPPERPEDLEQLERILGWRVYSRRDFDHRVKPLLERLLTYRLRASGRVLQTDVGDEIDALLSAEMGPPATPGHPDERRFATTDLARIIGHIEKR